MHHAGDVEDEVKASKQISASEILETFLKMASGSRRNDISLVVCERRVCVSACMSVCMHICVCACVCVSVLCKFV